MKIVYECLILTFLLLFNCHNSMVIKLRKSPLPNADRYANEFQRKYDEVRHRFEAYGSASGMNNRWNEQDFDEVQQWVEAWLCREMYAVIFPQSADGPISQDYLQDEQLQAKIAALNFLDLTLEHLGFVLEHPEDVEHIAQVVREGGVGKQFNLVNMLLFAMTRLEVDKNLTSTSPYLLERHFRDAKVGAG